MTVASFGTIVVDPGANDTSPSVIWSITRSDSPSETTAPSSEVGSAAVPNTSVSPPEAFERLFAASVAAVAVSATTVTASSDLPSLAHRSPFLTAVPSPVDPVARPPNSMTAQMEKELTGAGVCPPKGV